MKWKVPLLYIEFRRRYPSLGKLRYFLVQRKSLFLRYVAVTIRIDGEENFGIPRNFIDALSVSSKREKRYPRHMNGFPRLETFISSFTDMDYRKIEEKKNVRWRAKSPGRDSSLSMAATSANARILKRQNVFIMQKYTIF